MDFRHDCRCVSARARCRREGAGFTLIEVLLVLGIMAIILAMGIPPMARVFSREPIRQAETSCMEGLAQARAQAILRGVPLEFFIGVTEGETAIVIGVRPPALSARTPDAWPVAEGGRPDTGPSGLAPIQAPLFHARLPEGVTFRLIEVNFVDQLQSTGDVGVRFHPNGTSDDFVAVLHDGGELRKIQVDPVTGLADSEVLQ